MADVRKWLCSHTEIHNAVAERLLVVEDDDTAAAFIIKGMTEEGFQVSRAVDGREGFLMASEGQYGAIILDRMLPKLDGMASLMAMRAAGVDTPVILLSALGAADERVAGLTSGANDYLVKPFVFAELLARVRLLLHRNKASQADETRLVAAGLELDLLKRRVIRDELVMELQPREFMLLEFLMRRAGQIVTRTMLLEGVWDYHFDPGTNIIDVHISRLRRKLEEGGDGPVLHTIRGVGYRLGQGA